MGTEVRLRRRRIPTAVRVEVLSRDGMVCRYCGREVVPYSRGDDAYRPDRLHLDHVIPWAMGGSDEADNLAVSCADCNLRRVSPPRGAAAENRLLWRKVGDEYHWRDSQFRPPGRLNHKDPDILFTLDEAAEILGRTIGDIFTLIVTGSLLGTCGVRKPIRVAFPGYLADHVNKRMDEMGWVE